ncbi:MAG TPA: transcription-repair coupling factor [Anaerolineales bacterium]|nr:transcription-repair coupling factor [Anaerolineales bacterium]
MKDLDLLIQPIRGTIRTLVTSLQAGEFNARTAEQNAPATSLGLRRSARLPFLAALHAELGQPLLLLTDRTDRALTLADELALLAPQAVRQFFPEPTPLFYENAPWGETTRRERLIVLTTLAAYHVPSTPDPASPPIIIAPARALMARTLPRRDFIKSIQVLKPGKTASPEVLARYLVSVAYEPVNTVIAPGQFARRGGILDLWVPAEPKPVRLEFYGDEIDTLRRFDPSTQRSLQSQLQLLVTPAREFIAGENASISAFSVLTGEEEGQPGLNEFHLPLLHPSPASLLDYLPRQGVVLLDNFEDFQNTIQEVEEQALELRAGYIEEGLLPTGFPLPYLPWSEIIDRLATRQSLELGPSSAPEAAALAERFSSGPRFGGRLKPLMEHLTLRHQAGDDLVVVSRQAARLEELWSEAAVSDRARNNPPRFMEGSLAEGWILTLPMGPVLHLLTDGEIFGWRRPEPRQRQRAAVEAPESAYADLQVGDWVVHIEHGIGRFLGLVNRVVEGIEREYLAIEYAEGDQLFVPVYQADRLSRYVGPDSRLPSPSRLGGVEWRNARSRVKEAVEEVAEDLLDLYAQRQVVTGYSFSNDTHWQGELEASFPYIETDDQASVIAKVKQDMESPRPMDRLICGDVGYGKTEVALRAAFKAVMDGKQVAVLVPTTVLAQQHYNTFRERLAAFPVEVEMLSRFRTAQQQREILFRLAMGSLDIVIGTHRLLQGDVEFKDLGLLIIDEEQRFGVTHKEHLKKMRTEVDVITLTATPIPRTLYMALTGVRDISTINTPPEERLPIVTHVGPYSKRLVRQAVLRELERGGQVFFVHNRVQTISAMRSHLEHLIPEARIVVAHGQMDEDQLSRRMEQFAAGEIDVLLSTSIIESGLDIPNANTLIVDRADAFGLSQLYQLRGRVGRGAQRAYAYFFKHKRKVPSLEGHQRLETIAENTQLGAGFSIAMRDLEIRGTGDILGTRQHGNIAAVGFHLYTRLLSEAVSTLRHERDLPPVTSGVAEVVHRPLVSVDLPIHVNLPADYVPDKNMRLRLYRRIADLRTISEVEALVEEFNDRFGPPPEPVSNLFFQLKIKLLAEKSALASVNTENEQIVLRFRNGAPPLDLPDLGPQVRLGKTALWIPIVNRADWQERLEDILERLRTYQQQSVPG